MLWTLLILILCFLPANEFPDVRVPFVDKWTHFILFGVFSFLWLASILTPSLKHFIIVFISSVILGWLVEVVQGQLTMLGRSQDNMDVLADGIGGALGTVIYYIGYRWYNKTSHND